MEKNAEKLVEVQNLKQYFQASGSGLFKKQYVKAVDDVSFFIRKGETLGLVGESGCGKTTTGRTLLRLYEPTSGRIIYDGQTIFDSGDVPLYRPDGAVLNDGDGNVQFGKKTAVDMLPYRRKMQIVFQDPYASLDPRMTVGDIVGEAIDIHHLASSKEDRRDRIITMLQRVGLNSEHANRYPHEFSGGQRQRVGIARALASDPKILLCDEATSALDPQTTKAILALIRDINKKLGLTVVIITHEMQVIKDICDKVAVIENGVIAEQGSVLEVFTNPQCAITKEFISVINSNDLPIAYRGQEISAGPAEGAELLVRLTFVGEKADDPVINELIRSTNITVSILFGNIDQIQHTPYGRLIVGFSGKPEDIEEAFRFLSQKDVKVEVIGYVRRND